MIYHVILVSVVISFLGVNGEVETATVNVLDHSPYYKCLSNVSCTRLGDSTIWLDLNKMHLKDDCGRSPLFHELLELKYKGHGVHSNCNLNVQIVR